MKLNILLNIPDVFKQKAIYTIENIFNSLSVDKVNIITDLNTPFTLKDINILYTYEDYDLPKKIHNLDKLVVVFLRIETVSFFLKIKKYDINNINYVHGVPCLFPSKSNGSFGFDIFAACFYFLSCWQEHAIKKYDNKDRIPLNQTIQYKLKIIRTPIVNQYLNLFINYILHITGKKIFFKKIYSNSNVVLLSHDIDHIDWPLSNYLKRLRIFLPKQLFNTKDLFGILYNLKNKRKIFPLIKNIEKKHDFVSTYFFLSDYPVKVENSLEGLKFLFCDQNNEVGHHISDKAIFDSSLKDDLKKFRGNLNNSYGERVHTLRFNVNLLFKKLDKYKYLYDSSLLFAEDLGYRTGFSYPHYIYDIDNDNAFKTLAINPNIMETTVFENKYLGMNEIDGFKEIKNFIKKNKRHNGILSILFHHSFFWLNYNTRIKLYKDLLKYLRENDFISLTHYDIYNWYNNNSSIIEIK